MTADRSMRQAVAELMVEVHLLTLDVAEYQVAGMDDAEVLSRFKRYTGMGLSVAKANTQSGSDFYQVFGHRDSDGTLRRRSTLFPVSSSDHERGKGMPELERKNLVRSGHGR